MEEIANTKNNGKSNLIASARYNLGRAYLQGFGVKQSSDEAERLWILAAQGDEDGSIRAQTALGLFYSQEESLDLQKVFL